MKILFSIILLSALTVPLLAQQKAKSFAVSGRPAPVGYLEYLPPGYESSEKKFPVMIFLHGSGESGDGTPQQLERVTAWGPPALIRYGHDMCFTVDGVKECFMVFSPQIFTDIYGWPYFVTALIDHILSGPDHYKADPDRIYLTGLSAGGKGVYEYAAGVTNRMNHLAAIAPIAARVNDSYEGCEISRRKIPVWAFHGRLDTVIPYSFGLNAFKQIEQCTTPVPTAELIFTTYEDRYHDSWIPAYDTTNAYHSPNLYQWLLRQRRYQLDVTSVEEEKRKAVSMQQNPIVGDKAFLEYADGNTQKGPITIWSVTGAKIIDLPEGTSEINTTSWKSGVYILQMVDASGVVTTERLVKTD
ncbi:MAG: T9SS type A sorting domain-containing protein [Chryseolinea sp.]